jgi:hypothetical protein
MSAALTDKYPLDFDAIVKGQVITQAELEQITGKRPGTDEYQFALLSLQQMIQEKTSCTVKICSKVELKVLTDEEASQHNHKLFLQNVRGMRSRFELNTAVDMGELSEGQRAKHERNLVVQSLYVQAITTTAKQIAVSSHKRRLPGRAEEKASNS